MSSRLRRRVARIAVVTFAVAAVVGVAPIPLSSIDSAGAAINHPGLVPDVPVTGYPRIVYTPGRETFAANQIGNFIVSGGNFAQVRLQNGTTIGQPYFTAWHIDTKEIVCTDITFDGDVLDIIPGDTPNSMFVSGRFNNVTDANGVTHTRRKIVKMYMPDCAVDTDFQVGAANGKINHMALVGSRLFIGGDYTTLGAVSQPRLAEVNATTGNLASFNLNVTSNSTSTFRGLAINPAGTRLIAGGRWSSISGVATGPTAVINIATPGTPSLTPHRSSIPTPTIDLQDAGVSPDGQYIALVYGTATVSDYVYLVPTTESPQTPLWTKYMRDSNFSVAISDEAVYVGGHFCKIDAGPGASQLMAPNTLDFCTGVFFAGGVWRSQLAALRISDGTPLTWNPGNNSFGGAEELRVTERGLLVGYDGDRTNGFEVGTTAVFDFGPVGDTLPPTTATITAPSQGATVATPVNVKATAGDNVAVTDYQYRLQADNGQWLQADSTLGTNPHVFTTSANGAGDLDTNVAVATADDYRIDVRALDASNNISLQWAERDVTITGGVAPTCTATISQGGSANLVWDAIPGQNSYQVRRNGSWVATVSATNHTTSGSMADVFVIRYWTGGSPTEIPCTNEAGGPSPACTATFQGNGDALIVWDAVAGVNTYHVRRNNGWIGSTAGTTFTDTTAGGNQALVYEIRYRVGGTITDVPCANVGGNPAPSCTATALVGGGIKLSWSAVGGVTSFQVRKNNGWIASVVGQTYTDTNGTIGDSYVIRYWNPGLTDLIC